MALSVYGICGSELIDEALNHQHKGIDVETAKKQEAGVDVWKRMKVANGKVSLRRLIMQLTLGAHEGRGWVCI